MLFRTFAVYITLTLVSMADRESHSVRNGVIGTVVGGIALAALGELWPPLKNAAAWVWSKVLAFFDLFGAREGLNKSTDDAPESLIVA